MSQNVKRVTLRDSIAFRYLMIATFFLVVVQLLFRTYELYTIYEHQKADLESKINGQLYFLSAVSPESILISDFLHLETLMEQTSEDPDIVYSVIVDVEGQPLTRFLNQNDPILASVLQSHSTSELLPILDEASQNPLVHEMRQQIVADNVILGEIWLGFSMASVQERLQTAAIITFIISILVSLLLAALTFPLFNRMIGKPLQEVSDLAHGIARGNFQQRAVIERNNEISQLKVAFNSMSSQLQEMVAEMQGAQKVAQEANQAAMRNEARTRLVVDTALDAVIEMDKDGFIMTWNKQAESTFGWPKDEVIGQRLSHIIVPHHLREAHEKGLTRYMRTGQKSVLGTRIEITALHRNGNQFPVELAISPLYFQDEVTFSAFVRDITKRKQTEETLRTAKEVAEAAAQAKSDFLANTSHEIRTPLNAIIGLTGLLLDSPLNTEQRDFIETIRNSGDALLTIINDILDFSKIDAGKLELEAQSFHLRQCVEDALDVLAPKAASKGLEIAYLIDQKVPSVVIGDITRLRQILVNLLSNAVKFTNEGEVVVSIGNKLLDEGHHQLHFTVRDTGIGIPADRMNRLFASFSQVDTSTTRKYGGTGLGLAISKRLAEIMGGTMWVESEIGKGSSFHFTINVEANAIQPELPYDKKQPELKNKRVLIVDDNETNRLILTRQVRSWGMIPFAVPSGPEALELIRQKDSFDLAILDMQMPDMDGLSLAEEIRRYGKMKQNHFSATFPLVMLTSLWGRAPDSRDILFAAQLTKPLKPSLLYDMLMSVFSESPTTYVTSKRLSHEHQIDPEMAKKYPLHILLAEDNVINQKVALRMLARMGYRAEVAANGLEVLDTLRRQSYDVVLMDIQMPEMDGLTATTQIRKRWTVERQPHIVAMTANAMKGDRERYLAQGMDDYVSKPVRIEELIRALRDTPRLKEKSNQVIETPVEVVMDSEPEPGLVIDSQPEVATRHQSQPVASQAEHTTSSSEPKELAIDLDAFKEMVGEDALDMLPDLMDIFFEEFPENIASLQQAATDGDLKTLDKVAHTLKGQCASIGAIALSKESAELMTLARQGQINQAVSQVAIIEQEYKRIEDRWQTLQDQF